MVRLGVVGVERRQGEVALRRRRQSGVELGGDSNVYVPRFGWVRPGIVWAMALNRAQDRLDLYFIDVKSGKSQLMMSESSDTWIDMHPVDEFELLHSGDRYLWTSWRDGYYHIYLYQFDNQNPLSGAAKLVQQLTHGDWDVESIDGVDEQHGIVYFTANEGDWRQANLYAVGLDGKNFHRVSKQDGAHMATFDPANAKYYVDNYSSLTTPPTLSFCTVNGECNAFWKPRSIEQYNLPTPKKVEFTAADGTTKLLGTILLPTGGPMMANGKAPMIVNPYGGPGAQTRTRCLGRRQLLLRLHPGAAGIRRAARRQSGHGESRQSVCRITAPQLRPERTRRSDRRGEAGATAVPGDRRQSPGLLGMELRRLLHALHHDAYRHVQVRRGRRPGHRLAPVRLDLHRALHGPAERQCRRLYRRARR